MLLVSTIQRTTIWWWRDRGWTIYKYIYRRHPLAGTFCSPCICMCIYIYIYTVICIYLHTCVHTYFHTYLHISVCSLCMWISHDGSWWTIFFGTAGDDEEFGSWPSGGDSQLPQILRRRCRVRGCDRTGKEWILIFIPGNSFLASQLLNIINVIPHLPGEGY